MQEYSFAIGTVRTSRGTMRGDHLVTVTGWVDEPGKAQRPLRTDMSTQDARFLIERLTAAVQEAERMNGTAAPEEAPEPITITAAMVGAIERATHFEHGWEVSGHGNLLRAMAQRKLIRKHDAGGTLTPRGMTLKLLLDQDDERRTFTPEELDREAPQDAQADQDQE